ncbi:hypothetical protein Tco_1340110 [Tanacetum coccineum]
MAHISDIKLIRTDTTLDLSQKAEKAKPSKPATYIKAIQARGEDLTGLPQTKSRYNMYPSIIYVLYAECFVEEITKGENNPMVYNLLLEYASAGTLTDLIEKSNADKKNNRFIARTGDIGLVKRVEHQYFRSLLEGNTHALFTGSTDI